MFSGGSLTLHTRLATPPLGGDRLLMPPPPVSPQSVHVGAGGKDGAATGSHRCENCSNPRHRENGGAAAHPCREHGADTRFWSGADAPTTDFVTGTTGLGYRCVGSEVTAAGHTGGCKRFR